MWKKLVGIFNKKKNKMNFSEKTLEEIEIELKNLDFQWIKGESMGSIEKFKEVVQDGPLRFVVFQNGGRMNVDLISEFMDTFPASQVRFDSNHPVLVPPTPESISQVKKSAVNSIDYGSSPSPGIDESPIYKLLKKQKPNWVNVNISLKLNLPTKSLYNVLINSFEDAESEIASYVTEGVEIEDIRNAIAESIKNSFYETKKTPPAKNLKTLEDESSED